MFLKSASIGENEWWQYLATLILVGAGTLIGQLPLTAILIAKAADSGLSQAEIAEMAETMDFSKLGLDQNLTIFLMLLAFVFGLVFLWIGVRFIHKKPFNSIINPTLKINWKKIFFSFGLWMALAIAMEFVFYLLNPDVYTFQFQPSQFFVLLLIAIFIFPLQTSFEELMFRGYLMQGIGLLSKYKWIPLLLTSIGFGTMHLMNPEVKEFGLGLSMTYYIGVGLFLGILTLMDNGLELALGVHAATNIYSALFVTFDASAVQTAALFKTSEVNMPFMLAGFFVTAIVFIAIVSKKYKWGSWDNCYGLIENKNEN
ncbi:MAG TPA: CPBP family intramembrane metalloprotease [Bacteroidetes bacterium]|nr:CPBP family intramembrane metalloprotease [Bacteroidota bacterium]